MNKLIFTILLALLQLITVAQNGYEIRPVNGINTSKDDIACGLFGDKLIVVTTGDGAMANEFTWNTRPIFYLNDAMRGKDFSEWNGKTKLFSYALQSDQGPASFNPIDSTIYFSTSDKYGNASGNRLKIYSAQLTTTGWTEPRLLPFCAADADYTHPHFCPDNNLMVFSSNRAGGQGMMDIWYIYKTKDGWSEPFNLGSEANSSSNELFPTVHDGDIYYSTNSKEERSGYDLMKANGKQQWKSVERLASPFNSAKDDMMLLFINEEKSLLTSNREGGLGGDDIYLIQKNAEDYERHEFTATLEHKGLAQSNTRLTAANVYKEIVLDEVSDSIGMLNISALRLNQNYKLQLTNVDPSMFTDFALIIRDENGNVVKEIRFNSFGFAMLELLPLSYINFNLLAADDKTMLLPEEPSSLLNIKIEGQLFNTEPGDIGRGEPITILDEEGIPAAIAFTNETGKFRFTDVKPNIDYTFKLAKASAAKNILIMDKGERITLPVLSPEVHYFRTNPEEAIQLVNEFNETIYVSPKDIFVINRIYYDYNSALLTKESCTQLDKLEILVKKNENINIELRSHTDSRGNEDYNLDLSKKRAQSAVKYLSMKGISPNRFQPIGYGETQLLNECLDGTPCMELEHSINRRTEIKLYKKQ